MFAEGAIPCDGNHGLYLLVGHLGDALDRDTLAVEKNLMGVAEPLAFRPN